MLPFTAKLDGRQLWTVLSQVGQMVARLRRTAEARNAYFSVSGGRDGTALQNAIPERDVVSLGKPIDSALRLFSSDESNSEHEQC